MLLQQRSLLLENQLLGSGIGPGRERHGNTVMTAATCKTQAEQTMAINHPADALRFRALQSCCTPSHRRCQDDAELREERLPRGALFPFFICEL
ncbi:hypothetical protein EYF80_001359 [Liparis tanakae]|uniref:Uncharacterized protein n=1 Tax=Liparis tanakae TaxID=230148 RepID=A0A4Z2JEB1_9TELE|nr:hypothetical protein EYF80_001359 [Liparis tanakae]